MLEIEIDGKKLQVEQGMTIIEAADLGGIAIPRFCYHKKLSIAANCRMCLVEVEKMGKPMPACATPVTPEMKVFTQSKMAKLAQRGVMEYLLINHPLDCPICDQGGECELQDNSMGYGAAVSHYAQPKRAVFNEDLGPLIETEMTRCIHCTRCVRFGEEIAGLRELGATFRGEHMQIGTYVKHIMRSELSGNVIDICPVGALTSKPFRYAARAWEMTEHPSIAAHDCVGSAIYVHSRSGEYSKKRQVLRVVPREAENINENWISDRDRFSYLGLYHQERLLQPWMKQNERGHYTDWPMALNAVAEKLQDFLQEYGADELAFLISPNATVEEAYLLQKLARALGCCHIDHRLRQLDFADQHLTPAFPNLGKNIAELAELNAVLLLGSDVQREQPIIGYHLFKAWQEGAKIMAVNPRDEDFNFILAEKVITVDLVQSLAAILAALYQETNQNKPEWLIAEVTPAARQIAKTLQTAERGWIVLGEFAVNHPQGSVIRALTRLIGEASGAAIGVLTEGANAAGHWLAGTLPHRQAAGAVPTGLGLNALQLLTDQPKRAYFLWGFEPEFDCAAGAAALQTLVQAEWVVCFNSFITSTMQNYADMVLPLATSFETDGTLVNVAGTWQSFMAITEGPGSAKSGWKILTVLAKLLDIDGFAYATAAAVRDELHAQVKEMAADQPKPVDLQALPPPVQGLVRLAPMPMYRVDGLLRRAAALQETYRDDLAWVKVNTAVAAQLALTPGDEVLVQQGQSSVLLTLGIDDQLAENAVLLPGGLNETAGFGQANSPVQLKPAKRELA